MGTDPERLRASHFHISRLARRRRASCPADSGAAMSGLTDQIRHSVNNPLTSTDFDFTAALDDVLSTVDLSATDGGGKVRFYGGADPLIASPFQFAAAAAVALGAKGVAASAIWRERGGSHQDIAIDNPKASQRLSGFGDGRL